MITVKQICSSEETERLTLVRENDKIHLEIQDSSDLLFLAGLNIAHALCHIETGVEVEINLEIVSLTTGITLNYKIPANDLCYLDEDTTKRLVSVSYLAYDLLAQIDKYKITENIIKEEFPSEININ